MKQCVTARSARQTCRLCADFVDRVIVALELRNGIEQPFIICRACATKIGCAVLESEEER